MKKNLFLAALAFVALASCTSDEFFGENTPPTTSNTAGAIQFTSNAPRITRADGGATAAETLGYKFKVYATKTVTESNNTTTSNVFASGAYSSEAEYNANPVAYWVWYTESTAGTTASNTRDWDYVGAAGNHGTSGKQATIESGKDQTIKYWDYSADNYEFVAYSATVGTPTITKYQKDGFTVSATASELAGLYVADKVTLKSTGENPDVDNNPTKPATSINKIGGIVQFTFRSSATKVRLGIYETIPGYVVQNVNFRPNASEFTATTANAKLSGSFNGFSSAANATYTVTYNSDGLAVFSASAAASTYFDFGTFASATPTAIGETSTSPMWASGSSDYQSVLPNTDATKIGNMILYVDYDLYNSVSGETIHVKGAKAVVPSIYMKWNPNYAYTYLFKISDNTNGTTGVEGTSPEGIYPITFDALTIAGTNDEVGTITTVSTPAITTYQEGSVVDIEKTTPTVVSEHGITYAASDKPIYITVNTDGTLANLESSIKLYKLDAADADATEAELLLAPSKLTGKEVTSGNDQLSVLSSAESLQGIAFAANTTAKFSPAAGETYAVEYSKAAVAESYVAATGTYVSGTTYYEDNNGVKTIVDTSGFTESTDVSSYYVLDTPASAAVKAYKVIKVAASTPEP